MHLIRHNQSMIALGGDVDLTIVTDMANAEVEYIYANLWLKVLNFEKRFSRFLPSSELSAFNRQAGDKVDISNEFRNILRAAVRMSKFTDGLYNPFILPILHRTGYRNSFLEAHRNDRQEDYSLLRVASPDELIVGDNYAIIPKNTAIDLGGCGKGYLADLLAAEVSTLELQGYWFSIGGDVVGSGLDENSEAWHVAVQDAANPDGLLPHYFKVKETGFAIATSGVIERKGRSGGRNWHHLIDPETELPATTDILLASVYAENALTADVLASCVVITGSIDASTYLNDKGPVSAIIQRKGRGREVLVDIVGKVQNIEMVLSI